MRKIDEVKINGKKLSTLLKQSAAGKIIDLSGCDLSFVAFPSSANLSFADLSFANLSSANLSFANLRSANLRFANLSSANLSSANLSSADLSFANLSSADLSFAIYKGIKIKHARIFSGLYSYLVIAIVADDNTQHVALGCHCRTRAEWKKDFWNNTNEFPDDGSEKTELRKLALKTACAWLDLQKKLEK